MKETPSNTKETIGQAFEQLICLEKTSNISVLAIAEKSGISRKTFYYHFPDRAMLAQWVFRYDMANRLRNNYPERSLIYPSESMRDDYPSLPFYARAQNGVRSIDGSLFFHILGEHIDERRDYYRVILSSDNASTFRRSVLKLYCFAFLDDIHFILGGRTLPENTCGRLAMYYANAGIMHFFNSVFTSQENLANLIPEEFSNINHESLSRAIENYFEKEERFEFFK